MIVIYTIEQKKGKKSVHLSSIWNREWQSLVGLSPRASMVPLHPVPATSPDIGDLVMCQSWGSGPAKQMKIPNSTPSTGCSISDAWMPLGSGSQRNQSPICGTEGSNTGIQWFRTSRTTNKMAREKYSCYRVTRVTRLTKRADEQWKTVNGHGEACNGHLMTGGRLWKY